MYQQNSFTPKGEQVLQIKSTYLRRGNIFHSELSWKPIFRNKKASGSTNKSDRSPQISYWPVEGSDNNNDVIRISQ